MVQAWSLSRSHGGGDGDDKEQPISHSGNLFGSQSQKHGVKMERHFVCIAGY